MKKVQINKRCMNVQINKKRKFAKNFARPPCEPAIALACRCLKLAKLPLSASAA
jgi:hypothetical protein